MAANRPIFRSGGSRFSWVLHQRLNIEELGQPALASIGRILEVSGSGLCRALWIQVIRYPLLGMPTQEGGRMVVTESQMAASIRDGAVQDELLHLPEQSLAHFWATTFLRGRTVSFTREARVLLLFLKCPPHSVAGVT